MKKLTITVLASIALAATSFAGHAVVTHSDFKDKKVIVPPTCFNERELQLDVFGAYQDGNANGHAGPIGDHGWGGGIGVNYFLTRYIGVGAEGYWVSAQHNSADPSVTGANPSTVFHNINGSLIFRYPIDSLCLAPYGFVGGGAVLDGHSWAVGFVGVGLEYRVVPNKVGLFIDGRWNYYGDRFGNDVQNNFTTRAGLRLVF